MSRRKIHKEDDLDLPGGDFFKRSLQLFQQLVDKTVAQKREERLGLRLKDYEEMDYDKFFDAVKSLFGPDVKAQDVKTFYRKISNNPDMQTEWCEQQNKYTVTQTTSYARGVKFVARTGQMHHTLVMPTPPLVFQGKSRNMFHDDNVTLRV